MLCVHTYVSVASKGQNDVLFGNVRPDTGTRWAAMCRGNLLRARAIGCCRVANGYPEVCLLLLLVAAGN